MLDILESVRFRGIGLFALSLAPNPIKAVKKKKNADFGTHTLCVVFLQI
jgi:hypothetical protein